MRPILPISHLSRLTFNSPITIRSRLQSTSPTPTKNKNRIYQPIRSVPELDDLLLLSSSSHRPLLTFWTASWCPSCRQLLPQVKSWIEDDGFGEEQGGVGFVEVEYDAPDAVELGLRYMITSIPTMLAFHGQEAMVKRKVSKVQEMKDREWVKRWVENEASKGGGGGGTSGGLFGLFGRGQ